MSSAKLGMSAKGCSLASLLVLCGCGGSGPSEAYLSGVWTESGSTARFRVIEKGSQIEGWMDDGRRIGGTWVTIVLTRPYESGVNWNRVRPGEYESQGARATLEVRR